MRTVRKSNLTVISPPAPALGLSAESPSQRIRRLQAEARALARDHLEELAGAMRELSLLAQEIAEGGDAYPVGAREMAGRLAEDLGGRSQTLLAIVART